ncbi:MAG: hypothetical protein F4Y22_08860 [Gammaproteobacteria bacterium]|nr:hypothetical protein [Gammaproteobacteria bacterium]MYH46521.1 hypothetical protein [Gammaproteobacteria bacterium]MYL14979.1 hypothetical protein [Gammaproteobacteria bacterium]
MNQQSSPPSPKNLMLASVIAFFVSVLVLLAFILPAEFGQDPLRTGELFGLTALSRGANPFEEQFEVHREDYVEFELGPFQSVEYKYLMDLDAPLVFSWLADGELYFDMHAHTEATEEEEEVVQIYEQGTASQRMGSMHAAFTGLHGWFWENRSAQTILVRLYTAGFYPTSTVYRDGGEFARVIEPIAMP